MSIPAANFTESYNDGEILFEAQLNALATSIETWIDTYVTNNFEQLAADIFISGYSYDNDGNANYVTPLETLMAKLGEDETVTGDWTFNGDLTFAGTVSSSSTFSSSGQPRSKAYKDSSNQSIANNSVEAVSMNNESYDVGAMHDNGVNNSRIVVQSGQAGSYSIVGQATFDANSFGSREVYIYKNGSEIAKATAMPCSASLVEPRAKAYLDTANQSLTTATATAIAFNAESYDSDTMHDNSTNNSRITIPSNAGGLYLFNAQVTFDNNATGRRIVEIRKNGTAIASQIIFAGDATYDAVVSVSVHDVAIPTDYYEVFATQASGGNLDVVAGAANTFFEASAFYINDSSEQTTLQVYVDDAATVNDYYELRVKQTSGSSLDVIAGSSKTFISARKVW